MDGATMLSTVKSELELNYGFVSNENTRVS